jgi:hypothetical protein
MPQAETTPASPADLVPQGPTLGIPKAPKVPSGFYCQECGHAFRTVKAAERASFGPDGCPNCGGADIDLGKPVSS